jgi:hypothetical protein
VENNAAMFMEYILDPSTVKTNLPTGLCRFLSLVYITVKEHLILKCTTDSRNTFAFELPGSGGGDLLALHPSRGLTPSNARFHGVLV